MAASEAAGCKFFRQGYCVFGDQCKFSHDVSDSSSSCKFVPASVVLPCPKQSDDEDVTFQLQSLSLAGSGSRSTIGSGSRSWAEAPVFVPRALVSLPQSSDDNDSPFCDVPAPASSSSSGVSWAAIVNPRPSSLTVDLLTVSEAESQLCPFGAVGECRYGECCAYVHGDLCDMCGKSVLHPTQQEQRRRHQQSCMRQHEEAMELAFATAKSKDKICGVCMEVVLDKEKGEARFGILPNCNHCFCLNCLRKWRQAKFENKIIRSCPECRQTSDFICPSRFWVDTKEEKESLLTNYKEALTRKECKYFKRGQGECPFGNKCFYKHVDSDGRPIDVGPPQRRPRRENADGDIDLFRRLLILDFIEEREGRLSSTLPLEYIDILDLLSDTDSDDMEFMF